MTTEAAVPAVPRALRDSIFALCAEGKRKQNRIFYIEGRDQDKTSKRRREKRRNEEQSIQQIAKNILLVN